MGLSIMRLTLGGDPIAKADGERIMAPVAPMLQAYIDGKKIK